MRKIGLLFLLLAIGTIAFSQEITVRFTGRLNDAHYCRLDRVLVTDLSQNWTVTVSYPDTIIVLGGNNSVESFVAEQGLAQNVPNPFDCETSVELYLSQREEVRVQLLDASGKIYAEYSGTLDAGVNAFVISAAIPQTYILNANAGNRSYSIRMVNIGSGCKNGIKYLGRSDGLTAKLTSTNDFFIGDNMRYIGYATIEGQTVVSDVVEQLQTVNQQVRLNFTHIIRPSVETLAAVSITTTGAIIKGNVTDNGGNTVTEMGFYYGTSASNLTQRVVATSVGNSFFYTLDNLNSSTTYYYKAYATNSAGTSTGTVKSFTTETVLLPTVQTNAATDIRETEATISGRITSDGGATITDKGFLYGTSESNLNQIVHSSSGTAIYTETLTGLTASSTYYYKAYATNSAGTAYGDVVQFTTDCECGNIIVDNEGNQYETVQIGEQCWMAQNLRTTTYPDGTSIPLESKRFYPDNNSSNVDLYGYLYTWHVANHGYQAYSGNVRGICPSGWHLPSGLEWIKLKNYLNSHSEYQCDGSYGYIAKSLASTYGWENCTNIISTCNVGYNPESNNSTGFGALPAGQYNPPYYTSFGQSAIFWTTSFNMATDDATIEVLGCSSSYVNDSDRDRSDGHGFSVRCVRDY